jgi:hypothetical protein
MNRASFVIESPRLSSRSESKSNASAQHQFLHRLFRGDDSVKLNSADPISPGQ